MDGRLVFVTAIFLAATGAFGYGGYVDRVPNGEVNSCDTRHLNGYFRGDFLDEGAQWTVALAAMDSDGDGYTNGAELLDPEGDWSEGEPDPGDPEDVTNPDDPGDFPTAVSQTSFGEVKAGFAE